MSVTDSHVCVDTVRYFARISSRSDERTRIYFVIRSPSTVHAGALILPRENNGIGLPRTLDYASRSHQETSTNVELRLLNSGRPACETRGLCCPLSTLYSLNKESNRFCNQI